MKATVFIATLALSLAAAVSAEAQTPPAPPPAAAPMTPPAPPPRHAPMDFTTQKADILAKMDQRMADMTKTRECVNAASSKDDLKACHPHGHHRGHHAPA